MRTSTIALFCLIFAAGAMAQHKTFDKMSIVKVDSVSKNYTTCQMYKDSLGNPVITDLKMLLDFQDSGFFEEGNILSGKRALLIGKATPQSFGLLLSLKRLFENSVDSKGRLVSLTNDEVENVVATVAKWISDRKLAQNKQTQ